MAKKVNKRKGSPDHGPAQKKKKKSQLVLTQKVIVEPVYSDASTLVWEPPLSEASHDGPQNHDESTGNTTFEMEVAGEIISDNDSLSSLSDDEGQWDENAPTRQDMPVNTGRWQPTEVDALMTALNVNRDAIKYHFEGSGGGRDVKRQAWRDVVAYVNNMAETHRTVKQCRTKTSDYTQRVKAKFNRLRYEVATTGKGKIKKGLQLKETEGKGLDFLREEAVRGIPGIEELPIGGATRKPCSRNESLLWCRDRQCKPDYDNVKMERQGVPKNYKDKNKRRLERIAAAENKKEHEIAMKMERRKERSEARRAERTLKREMKMRKKELRHMKKEKKRVKKEKVKKEEKKKKKGKKDLKYKKERRDEKKGVKQLTKNTKVCVSEQKKVVVKKERKDKTGDCKGEKHKKKKKQSK